MSRMPRVTSGTSRSPVSPFVLGPADDTILQDVARLRYLTNEQLCRRRYHAGSLTYVRARTKRLADAGYLQRIFLPRPAAHGSGKAIYTLARKGLNYLRLVTGDEALRYHPSEEREHAYLFLSHTLAVNDVLISLELFCQTTPGLTLQAMRHERQLKREPVTVTIADGERTERVAVIPDAWVDLRLCTNAGAEQACFALELDRGTEEQKRWRRKVRALLTYTAGPYTERFGTDSLTIAVVVLTGDKRLLDLLRWTEAELTQLNALAHADLFWFTTQLAVAASPHTLFATARWYRPCDRRDFNESGASPDYRGAPLLELATLSTSMDGAKRQALP